jgi:hypothetical protein
MPTINIRSDDQAKELTEELAALKGHQARIRHIENALKEWCGLDSDVEIYHDGKTMTWGAAKADGKYPLRDLRNPWSLPSKNNLGCYLLMIKHGVAKVSAWACFKATKRELEKAVKEINDPEFNAALADLVNFDNKPRFGFKTIDQNEKERENDE